MQARFQQQSQSKGGIEKEKKKNVHSASGRYMHSSGSVQILELCLRSLVPAAKDLMICTFMEIISAPPVVESVAWHSVHGGN